MSTILTVYWALTFMNLKGVQISASIASFCAIVGLIIPLIMMISFALIWLFQGNPLQISFNSSDIFPSLHHSQSWISLTAIITSFLGIELATVHVKNVENPKSAFPRALSVAVVIILFTMLFGALAIAFVIPEHNISLITGAVQAFEKFLSVYHIHFLLPVVIILLLIGSVGSIINWMISPAKGLMQAAEDGFLPKYLQKQNKNGVPSRLLILQALLVSLITMAFFLVPSVNGAYWLLTALSTQLYVVMYILMFISAIVLRKKENGYENIALVISSKKSIYATATLGIIGCVIALIVGFFPPLDIDVGGTAYYELLFSGGWILMLLPVLLFYWYKH